MEGGREDGEASRPHTINNAPSPVPAALTPAATPPELARAPSSDLTHDQDSDAESVDMDVSDDEDEPDSKPAPPMPMPAPPADTTSTGTQTAGSKRKLEDTVTNGSSSAAPERPNKRPRSDDDLVSVWQHIFTFLPPASLGRCLRVSKTFNAYLTSTQGETKSVRKNHKGEVKRQRGDRLYPAVMKCDSNKIWATARKVQMPNMPKPLVGQTELAMLQLVGERTCQFCYKEPASPPPSASPMQAGPGPYGVRVIWPFAIRTCGACLQENTSDHIALLKTLDASLILGLPYILLTNEMHYIPEFRKQAPGGLQVQPGVSIRKVFYRELVGWIVSEHEAAKSLNNDDEWRKGLYTTGKAAMADAARWEKWESQFAHSSDLVRTLREYDRSSFPAYFDGINRRSIAQHQPLALTGDGSTPGQAPAPTAGQAGPVVEAASVPQRPMLHQSTAIKPAGDPPEIEQRRRARKEEIVRRCAELQPPLDHSDLPGMKSFQAAMLIAQPLTDQAWEALRPRLLAEKEALDLEAHLRNERTAMLQAAMPSDVDATFLRPAKEIYDKSYDVAQEPLRRRLAEYVDEHVNAVWNGNPSLDQNSSPIFAAKAIVHVQKRYNEDKAAGALPLPGVIPSSKGPRANPLQDSLQDPLKTPFLSLDNVKWIYENKIKPYVSEPQIFLCAGCIEDDPSNRNPKWMALEGMIQHYGAKHTRAFSKGNITVFWQTAEFPEETPFHPQPEDFIKVHMRQSFAHKGRGYQASTPQPRREAAYEAPRPAFSYQIGALANVRRGDTPPAGPQYDPQSDHDRFAIQVSDQTKANDLAADCREVWAQFEGMSEKELLNCVRLKVAVHHAIVRFVTKYRFSPKMDLLTDALATNPVVQPIKAASGLACRLCVDGLADAGQSYYGRVMKAKLYNTNTLLNHFKMAHDAHNGKTALLSTDMLELPNDEMIREVVLAQGMDDARFRLIAEAFPTAFPGPSADIRAFQAKLSMGLGRAGSAGKTSQAKKSNGPPLQGGKKKKGKKGNNGGARDGSREPVSDEPQGHEYDPRNPKTSTEEEDEEAIAAKYDTDVARAREAARAPPAAVNGNGNGLRSETMAALRALQSATGPSLAQHQLPPRENYGGIDRPPSVGRDEYAPAPQATLPQPNGSSTAAQPDIAAILAKLTGATQQQQTPVQQHAATPNGRLSASRDSNGPRSTPINQGAVDHLYRSLSYSKRDSPGTNGYPAYQTQYRPSVDPPTPAPAQRYDPPGFDLAAALERNARHFSHNQSVPPPQQQTYAAPPPPQRSYSPAPQHVAPPRYAQQPQYVYEDQQPQYYAHGQPAPVQYVQRPPPRPPQQQQQANGYAPQQQSTGYAHQPAQRTVYVDEHGREVQLIPVDAGPQYGSQPQQMPYGGRGGSYDHHAPQQAQGHAQQGYYVGGQYGSGGGGGR